MPSTVEKMVIIYDSEHLRSDILHRDVKKACNRMRDATRFSIVRKRQALQEKVRAVAHERLIRLRLKRQLFESGRRPAKSKAELAAAEDEIAKLEGTGKKLAAFPESIDRLFSATFDTPVTCGRMLPLAKK